uniref:Reverse transcriptase Ty1/copia-type domain-containing protein n=1 Tax=Solanum lycopersicum TaxID=4081 RepID=A0A3Q7GEW2_SOLLC
MQGHVESNCFRLHGYPPDWKFKKKGTGNIINAYNVQIDGASTKGKSMDSSVNENLQRAPQMTADQHGHIMKMLDGNVSTANAIANMAGLKWIIDSGATNHMISNLDLLHNVHTVKTNQNSKVHLPNGGVTLDLTTGKLKGIGKEKDGLYFLVQQQRGAKPAWTPLEANVKLTTQELDCVTGEQNDEPFEDRELYQRLVGKMLYLTMTMLDIAYSVQTLSQFLQNPKKSPWEAALRVMRYIKREPGLGILLSSKSSNKISVYCDADWASCPNTRRSVSGFIIKHGETLLSWKSKKQNVVSKAQQRLNIELWQMQFQN